MSSRKLGVAPYQHGTEEAYYLADCECTKCKRAAGVLEAQEVHGTIYRYRLGCKCMRCRGAEGQRKARYRMRLAERGFDGRQHGRVSTYCDGCRCVECKLARKRRFVDSVSL